MPLTEVYFYQEVDGRCDVMDWLTELREDNQKAFANCVAKLRLLKMFGYELRRPAADYLEDGIYELRAKHGTVQHRLLYFFHGRNVAVVAHGLIKKKVIPPIDIARAVERRKHYEQNPTKHRWPREFEDFDAPA